MLLFVFEQQVFLQFCGCFSLHMHLSFEKFRCKKNLTRNRKVILIKLAVCICALVNLGIWWRTKSSVTRRFTSNLYHLEWCVLWKNLIPLFLVCLISSLYMYYMTVHLYKCIYCYHVDYQYTVIDRIYC